jgi:hypothetical protein
LPQSKGADVRKPSEHSCGSVATWVACLSLSASLTAATNPPSELSGVQLAQQHCPPNNMNPNCPNNVIEQRRQEQAARQRAEQQRLQHEAAQRAAQQRAQQEAAQRAAHQRAYEEAQRAAQMRAQQEAAQRAAQQRAEQQRLQQEAAQRAAQQRAQEEAAQRRAEQQRAEEQRLQHEAAQKAAQEKAGAQQRAQEAAAQKAAQQKAAAQQRTQQEAAQKASLTKAAEQKAAQQRVQEAVAQKAAQQKAAAQQRAQEAAAQKAAQQKPAPLRAQDDAARKAAPKVAQQPAATTPVPPKAAGVPPVVPQTGKSGQSPVQAPAPPAVREPPKLATGTPQPPAAQKGPQQPAPTAPAPPRTVQSGPQPVQVPSQPGMAAAPRPATGATPQQPAAPLVQGQPPSKPVARPPLTPPARSVVLSPTATVVPRPDRSGYTIHQKNADGSNLVVRQTVLANGTRQMAGYRQFEDRKAGTSTRIHLNGYRMTVAPTFESRTTPRQTTFVRYHTGLRAADLPNGRPLYREQFVTVKGPRGVERQTVHRTVYLAPVDGRYMPLRTRVVQVYDVVYVYRRPIYVYRPVVLAPAFFVPFGIPFSTPIVVGERCLICPPAVVAFEEPPTRYADSMDLLADMQIAGPLVDDDAIPAEGSLPNLPQNVASLTAGASDPGANLAQLPADAEIASLRNQVDELQQQLSTKAGENAELQAALSQPSMQRTNLRDPANAANVSGARGDPTPMKVPEYARQIMRKQVRLNIAQQRNGNPLLLSEIIDAGYAPIYVFQSSAPIDTEDAQTGEHCTLSGGDLTQFQRVPDGSSNTAQMRVIASRAGHCQVNQIVHVNLEDLQEMLNGFSQRVEGNMKKLSSCLSPRGACTRI